MENEIWTSYDSASVLYAFVYRQADKYIYDVGDTAFEEIGTWDDARAGECDIQLTAVGDMHFANFPVVAAGTYDVEIRLRIGASPDTDDPPVAQGQMIWDGTAEILPSDISADVADLQTDVTDALSNLDNLIAGQNRVLNVYTETARPASPVQIISE